jgi:hypothetical protein
MCRLVLLPDLLRVVDITLLSSEHKQVQISSECNITYHLPRKFLHKGVVGLLHRLPLNNSSNISANRNILNKNKAQVRDSDVAVGGGGKGIQVKTINYSINERFKVF